MGRTTKTVLLFGSISLLAFAGWYCVAWKNLEDVARPSGWILFGLIVFLGLYNSRKKVPLAGFGRSRTWYLAHTIFGSMTLVVFLFHVGWRWPHGLIERVIGVLFLVIYVSGVCGAILSRLFARRLQLKGGEVVYEEIPGLRMKLEGEANIRALKSVDECGSSLVLDFFTERLRPFFRGPLHSWSHICNSSVPFINLQRKVNHFQNTLSEKESAALDDVWSFVAQKDSLDYHYALQRVLKGWLFIHIPLSGALMLFVLVHIVLVYAFGSSAI